MFFFIPIAFSQMNFGDMLRPTMPLIRPTFICIRDKIFNTFYLMSPVIAIVFNSSFRSSLFFSFPLKIRCTVAVSLSNSKSKRKKAKMTECSSHKTEIYILNK